MYCALDERVLASVQLHNVRYRTLEEPVGVEQLHCSRRRVQGNARFQRNGKILQHRVDVAAGTFERAVNDVLERDNWVVTRVVQDIVGAELHR
jgi:hypothetical protein